MRAPRILLLAAAPWLVSASAPDPLAEARRQLAGSRAAAAAASARAEALAKAAAAARDAAGRAARREAALAARVERAEADVAAARARVAIVAALLERQRAGLAAEQAPVARLLGALQALARRPALLAVAQPGSVDDLVHVRAVLGTALPVVRARTATLRAELARSRRLRGQAALAAASRVSSRRALAAERAALAALLAKQEGQATALGRRALAESDRAIALGEAARDTIDRLGDIADAREVAAALARLPGPPRFDRHAPIPARYRLPVDGVLTTGLGEVSAAGVRARGLTFAVAPAAPVIAPAAGIVRYAGRFRSYGAIVILDHGAGWSTLVTGLEALSVARGARVAARAPIGTAPDVARPAITVELRRQGRPVDIAALLG